MKVLNVDQSELVCSEPCWGSSTWPYGPFAEIQQKKPRRECFEKNVSSRLKISMLKDPKKEQYVCVYTHKPN